MISKKLIITEEERKEIKTLYGLITEQDVTQKNPELTLDLAGTFGSGKYLIPNYTIFKQFYISDPHKLSLFRPPICLS
jgi:hypothetical protein